MKEYSLKEFSEILRNNGYFLDRISGGHHIFVNNDGHHISVPLHPNVCICQRIIKENQLKID